MTLQQFSMVFGDIIGSMQESFVQSKYAKNIKIFVKKTTIPDLNSFKSTK